MMAGPVAEITNVEIYKGVKPLSIGDDMSLIKCPCSLSTELHLLIHVSSGVSVITEEIGREYLQFSHSFTKLTSAWQIDINKNKII